MRRLLAVVAAIAILGLAGSALAVPRLQTYIVGSSYYYNYNYLDRQSWITNNNYFDLKVVGYWRSAGNTTLNAGSTLGCRNISSYDYMDCYLAISTPRNEYGQIWINGVEVTCFKNYFNAVPRGVRPDWSLPFSRPAIFGKFNFASIGRIDNNQINAYSYDHGTIGNPGWGDEILLNVVVNGYSWTHFDAVGVNSCGRTYTSPGCYDSSYFATPEPGTLSLLGVGLLGIVPFLRRRRK